MAALMPETQKYLTGATTHRLAAIDIGTNSVRLVVAEALRDGNYRVLDEEREPTRLGRSLQATGRLDEETIARSLAALSRFQQIAQGYGVEQSRAIATCAVREAKNGTDFCRRAKEELGLEIEVISAEQEAQFAFHSVRRGFDLEGKNIVLADIGGGSTEIVLASGPLVEAVYPTDLGAVRLSEAFGGGQAMAGGDFRRMVEHIDRRLRKKTKRRGFQPHLLVGSGGTFTNLAAMVMAGKNQSGLPTRGYRVTWAELRHLLDRLRAMPPQARRDVPGLNADRADIIVAGLAIIDRLLHRFGLNTIQVHSRGVRDGLLLTMLEETRGARPAAPPNRDEVVDRFARACGAEIAHGKQVARLAGEIYAQLAEPLGLPPEDRPLLETAARLKDVGYLINYERHHKHSYHLILNSRLEGFPPRELELIANVARYHRGAEPKKKHANYRQLSPADRRRARQMAAILRLAGGLDRGHRQQVQAARVKVREDDIEIRVAAAAYPDVDLWGARRRAGLFEKVFNRPLAIEWQGNGDRAGP
jgi:exopolyphosphatase/guanosine-5'-triphosphate,3'-diphosphate pyrophosphatase